MHRQLNDKYEILIFPIDYNRNFLELTKEEIQEFYSWFLNIKEQRLIHLCYFLFADSRNCLDEKNLNVIEILLINSIATSPKPLAQFNAEMQSVPYNLRKFARPSEFILDKRTISICFDIGLFMGELIINLENQIFWKLETDDRFSDYGQPVLAKKEIKFELNPFVVVKNAAAKMCGRTYVEGQLISYFDAWKKAFKVVK